MSLVRWTLSFLRPYRARVVAIALLGLVDIGLSALAPWPLKAVVDNVLSGDPLPPAIGDTVRALFGDGRVVLLVVIVVAGLLLQLLTEVVRLFDTQLQVDTGQRVAYDLRARLLGHLQALSLRHHILGKTADSVYRLEADAYCVHDLVMAGLLPLVTAFLKLAVMFAILARLDLGLALLSLAVVPFLYVCLRYYSARMIERAEQVKALESLLVSRAYETLSSIRIVKAFAREQYELGRFVRSATATFDARIRLTWQESLFSLVVTAITLTGTACVLGVGGLHVLRGELTVGSLLVVIAYLAAVYNPLSAIAHTTGSLQQAVVSARRVREVLALTPEPLETTDGVDAGNIQGLVEFEHVDFGYDPAHPILTDITFTARPGELVALVGLTGAGKTTLASLIPRFFEPTGGKIRIDGVELSRYALRGLREKIALVPQDAVLFEGTILDNIRYGRLDADREAVVTAARAAHVHEFVERLPQQYDTPVAEAGATLSGGERQRLGIARALLKDAPILILDEPTSSLDALSEARVFDALRTLKAGRTTIVIAHRLSTIRDASRILVLDGGRLVGQGTHEELLATSELYRRMCARLSVGRSLDDPETVDDLIQAGPR